MSDPSPAGTASASGDGAAVGPAPTADRLFGAFLDLALLGVAWVAVWTLGLVATSVVGLFAGVLVALLPSAAGVADLFRFLTWAVVTLLGWVVVLALATWYLAVSPQVDGQTPGKTIAGVRVVDADGGLADGWAHARRTAVLLAPLPLGAVIALIPLIGGSLATVLVVGWLAVELAAVLVADGQRIGDRVAGTLVVPAADGVPVATTAPSGGTDDATTDGDEGDDATPDGDEAGAGGPETP